ncbi:MAG: hypothetical protein FJZ90_09605, partial [Chloroflexi bacterium]|nr:hypothetical protein [Chloroflexota bacterium]
MRRLLRRIVYALEDASRATHVLLVLAAVIAVGTLGLLIVGLNEDALRHTLSHWTGEDDLREQIKGTAALAWLRLFGFPPRTDPYVPLAHSGLPPYGVNTFLEQEVEP